MLEPLRRESEVEFDTTGVLPGLSVLVHDGGVQQIVYNLITNAIKASPPGGVSMCLRRTGPPPCRRCADRRA